VTFVEGDVERPMLAILDPPMQVPQHLSVNRNYLPVNDCVNGNHQNVQLLVQFGSINARIGQVTKMLFEGC
jgi:hypothetical protein